jgi:hypothetical protein
MKYLLSILFIFNLLSCKNKSEKTFVLPSDDEINSIIEAVIYQDSLPVLKYRNYTKESDRFLAIDLENLKIFFPDPVLNYPPPSDFNVSIEYLISGSFNEKPFFQDTDSSFIIYQTRHLKSLVLKKETTVGMNIITSNVKKTSWNSSNNLYYSFTIPVLSLNHKRAYVERDFNCPDCGYGRAIYLEKINNKWVIIGRKMTWTN